MKAYSLSTLLEEFWLISVCALLMHIAHIRQSKYDNVLCQRVEGLAGGLLAFIFFTDFDVLLEAHKLQGFLFHEIPKVEKCSFQKDPKIY